MGNKSGFQLFIEGIEIYPTITNNISSDSIWKVHIFFPMFKTTSKLKILALNWFILLTYFILFQFSRQGWSNIANKYNFDNLGNYQIGRQKVVTRTKF